MVPHTADGRVMFALPWHGHTLAGTTDTPVATAELEPAPFDQEVDFILETASLYLAKKPERGDILSAFAGIRPLVRAADSRNTAALSRDHTIQIDRSGLVTICGGKWTTYRRMAQDCVDQAATLARLPERPCVTAHLRIHGWLPAGAESGPLAVYGSDAAGIRELIADDPRLASPLHPSLPYVEAEIVWAARREMARTVEDVLARRTRALVLNAAAAIEAAPKAARLMAGELGRDSGWVESQVAAFNQVARRYLVAGAGPADAAAPGA
jgi:glycerol-3-phosphate dehydrogenase